VHRATGERAKFALAAHVEPAGAAFACCIWMYVAAVVE
jgi:coiled-coil and C2 domain-containing protein 2A